MISPIAELSSVSRSYPVGEKIIPVLRDLHLTVHTGDRIVLFGPSGCGKTTLLHLLALLDTPDSGSYYLEGHSTEKLPEAQRAQLRAENIGLIFQKFHLLPYHSVKENIRLRTRYLASASPTSEDQLSKLVNDMGLAHLVDHPVRLLSGGEQQRVCIARACFQPPRLLLADEPTGNLDQANSEKVQELLSGLSPSTPIVVATHDPAWLPFATRRFQFNKGSLEEESVS